jgi:CBS domain-containing protein
VCQTLEEGGHDERRRETSLVVSLFVVFGFCGHVLPWGSSHRHFVGGVSMKVKEFMKTKLAYIDADSTVYEAIEEMLDKRIRSLVVNPENAEEVYGVITARDVVFKVLGKGLMPRDVKVSEIASKPVVCIDQDTKLIDAAVLMEKLGIARLFVCEGKKLLGIFTLTDAMGGSLILIARSGHVA